MLTELQPVLLKFLADTFDDTTSTVFPLLSSILLMVRRASPRQRITRPNDYFQAQKGET